MGLQAKVVNRLDRGSTTGTFTYSVSPMTETVAFLMTVSIGDANVNALQSDVGGFHVGFADGVGSGVAHVSECGGATEERGIYHTASNEECRVSTDDTGTVEVAADVFAFNAGNFILDFTTVDATQRRFIGLALGGSDITDVDVDAATMPTSTGNQDYTSGGFNPDGVFVLANGGTSLGGGNNDIHSALGFASATTERACFGASRVSKTNNDRTFESDEIISIGKSSAIEAEGDITSFAASGGGFTINWSTIDTDFQSTYFGHATIAGTLQFYTTTFAADTAGGNQSITGSGFTPVAAIFISDGVSTADGRTQGNIHGLIGLSDGTANLCITALWRDSGSVLVDSYYNNAKVLMFRDANHSTNEGEASVSSFDSNGLTLNWSTTPSNAVRCGVLMIGAAPAAGSPFGYRPLTLLGVGA